MRVVYMGTPDFAVGTLEKIIEAGHQVEMVVTQPDKPKGRSGSLSFSPVKECAIKHNLPVLQPERARDESFIRQMCEIAPDVIVVVAFGQILPKEIIELPRFGCVNVHASLLPRYRGASPIQWAVLDGCEYSGVTTMLMDEGLDTGDILMVREVKLDKKETGGSLFDRLSGVGAQLLVETLEGLGAGSITPVAQEESKATYVKMLSKAFGRLDFSKDVYSLERMVRGLNPWPSAYTSLEGKLLKLWDADVEEAELDEASYGKVVSDNKSYLKVAANGGYLVINELQLEGKKRMRTEDFLRGFTVKDELYVG